MEGFNCGGIVAAARQEESQQSPLGKEAAAVLFQREGPARRLETMRRRGGVTPCIAAPRLPAPRTASARQNSPGGEAPGRLGIINQKAATIVSGWSAVAGWLTGWLLCPPGCSDAMTINLSGKFFSASQHSGTLHRE